MKDFQSILECFSVYMKNYNRDPSRTFLGHLDMCVSISNTGDELSGVVL
jgi:hypothetical protein